PTPTCRTSAKLRRHYTNRPKRRTPCSPISVERGSRRVNILSFSGQSHFGLFHDIESHHIGTTESVFSFGDRPIICDTHISWIIHVGVVWRTAACLGVRCADRVGTSRLAVSTKQLRTIANHHEVLSIKRCSNALEWPLRPFGLGNT